VGRQIVVDRNIPLAHSAFRAFGDVKLLETNAFSAATVKDADVLVIRSETKVGPGLLEGSRVRFVGTATIGTDHIDTAYLSSRGIGFANAPGCNANAVKEYVLASLLVFSARHGFTLRGRTLGVVGVGHIGSKVVKMARALGMSVLSNDPPLARGPEGEAFVPLDDLMQADIVTLHVPLTRTGADRTYRLFDRKRLAAMKPGSILINTSRGAVVEGDALKDALRKGHLRGAALDVWEGEPEIDGELLGLASLGTPHIAGYSMDGKVNAVVMIRQALSRVLSEAPEWDPEIPPPNVRRISLAGEDDPDRALGLAVRQCYDIEFDDRQMRILLGESPEARSGYFMKLRTAYRIRREFSAVEVEITSELQGVRRALESAGFPNIRELP
jgi:erythronate-4-phosphate dehydrogenase